MDLSQLDEETIELVLQFAIHDLEELSASTDKGKQKADEPTAFASTIEEAKKELASFRANMASRRLARALAPRTTSIVNVRHNPSRLQPASRTESKATGKKSQNDVGSTTEPAGGKSSGKNQAQFTNKPMDSEHASIQPESSRWAASRQPPPAKRTYECHACHDEYHPLDIIQCSCTHEYCKDCLQTLFQASFTDETLFPPRCCRKNIPAKENEHVLSAEIVAKFEEKKIEFETTNRTYCQSPTCSAFIPPSSVTGTVGTCPQCNKKTCTMCKGKPHKGECPNDPAIQALKDLATKNGWQTCHSCHRVVELGSGCYHMSKSAALIVNA